MAIDLSNWARVATVDRDGVAEVTGRRIYILPTRFGVIFACLLFLMLLGAINYGNNPAYMLTFLLAGLGANGIYQTWRNLRGLRLRDVGADPVYAGDNARFRFRLQHNDRVTRPAIQLAVTGLRPVIADIPAGFPGTLYEIDVPAPERGRLRVSRLVLSTRFPLGLLRAWCYVDAEASCIVYPRPGPPWTLQQAGEQVDQTVGEEGEGNEDFIGLRGYRHGDSMKRIDWKSLARERGLLSKQFAGSGGGSVWLDWKQVPVHGVEARLAGLCRAVLDAAHADRVFGLRIPGREIPPGRGPAHLQECLQALALFERE